VFSPGGKQRLAVARQTHLVLFDATSGTELWRIAREKWRFCSLAFSPDGQTLVAAVDLLTRTRGKRPHLLLFCDPQTGKVEAEIPTHAGQISSVAFSPDGQWLATASDGVRVWEVASGKEVFCRGVSSKRREDVSRPLSVAFSPDGRQLASGVWDSTTLLWDLDPRGTLVRARPSRAKLEALWAALAAEPRRAYQAVWALAAAPGAARFLGPRLRPVPKGAEQRAEQLVGDLGHEEFDRRVAAERELRRLGEAASHALRSALDRSDDLEVRRRVERLLVGLSEPAIKDPEVLRTLRAVTVLRLIGTPEAIALLKKLAAGAPGARQTRAARAALAALRSQEAR
jgi:hypothetical protein